MVQNNPCPQTASSYFYPVNNYGWEWSLNGYSCSVSENVISVCLLEGSDYFLRSCFILPQAPLLYLLCNGFDSQLSEPLQHLRIDFGVFHHGDKLPWTVFLVRSSRKAIVPASSFYLFEILSRSQHDKKNNVERKG